METSHLRDESAGGWGVGPRLFLEERSFQTLKVCGEKKRSVQVYTKFVSVFHTCSEVHTQTTQSRWNVRSRNHSRLESTCSLRLEVPQYLNSEINISSSCIYNRLLLIFFNITYLFSFSHQNIFFNIKTKHNHSLQYNRESSCCLDFYSWPSALNAPGIRTTKRESRFRLTVLVCRG